MKINVKIKRDISHFNGIKLSRKFEIVSKNRLKIAQSCEEQRFISLRKRN